jgi:hypothetical protein
MPEASKNPELTRKRAGELQRGVIKTLLNAHKRLPAKEALHCLKQVVPSAESKKKLGTPLKVMCHGRKALRIAVKQGWLPGARYTNLRDIPEFDKIGLIDIDWQSYNFSQHLAAVKSTRPILTIAKDIEHWRELPIVLDQAYELNRWASKVVIVPKDPKLGPKLLELIPQQFLLGYSVPTKYGETRIALRHFRGRLVHLLGGRPDTQHALSLELNVHSFDGNRFTLDALYGDYFDGVKFRPHPRGGYYECIRASLRSINKLWTHKPRELKQ